MTTETSTIVLMLCVIGVTLILWAYHKHCVFRHIVAKDETKFHDSHSVMLIIYRHMFKFSVISSHKQDVAVELNWQHLYFPIFLCHFMNTTALDAEFRDMLLLSHLIYMKVT